MDIKGTLVPIGGNEDKGHETGEMHTLDFIDEGILAHIVRLAGNDNPKIVVIPTASSIPLEVGKNYQNAFTKLGCSDIHLLDIRSKKDAESDSSLNLVKSADCIMFSGGDQTNIVRFIGETSLHALLKDRYHKEKNFVIAGTSAGAMAMAKEMIAGGSSKEAFVKGAVNMHTGLGLLPDVIIDTHFIRRGRFGRQSEAVAKFPHLLGIGLAEDTGLIIKKGKEMEVIGSGMVIIFDAHNLRHNNEKILEQGTPMTMTNLIVHVLSNGDKYNIETREVKVLPVDSPFI